MMMMPLVSVLGVKEPIIDMVFSAKMAISAVVIFLTVPSRDESKVKRPPFARDRGGRQLTDY